MMDETEFKKNQQIDREALTTLVTELHFDSLQLIADMGEEISRHHFNNSQNISRFEKEILLLGYEDALDNFLCRAVALETSEASETLEEARLPNRTFENLLEEQADVLIRTLNCMTVLLDKGNEKGLIRPLTDIGTIVYAKMVKNIERPPSHGGKRF